MLSNDNADGCGPEGSIRRRATLGVVLALLAVTAPVAAVAAADAPTEAANAGPSQQWMTTLGGDGDDKLATGIAVDGGYLVVGWSDSDAGDDRHDGYVAMLDRAGEIEWERTYGGPGVDRLFEVVRVEDGYLLAGLKSDDAGSAHDGWLLKLDESGDVEWQRTYGEDGPDAFWALAKAGDSIYAAGWRGDADLEAWAIEVDRNGDRKWSETYDTVRSGADEYVNSIFVTGNGDLLMTGSIEGSTADPSDAWVLRTDGDGELKWQQDYGGAEFDRVHDAAAASDGGFVLAGRTASEGRGGLDGWLLKITGDGETEWSHTYGTEMDDGFSGVLAASDGGYVLSGTKHVLGREGADGWVVRTDEDGNRAWSRTYGASYWDKFWPVVEGHGGGYLVVGESTSFGGNRDGWVVRLGGPAVAALDDADGPETTVTFEDSPVQAVTLTDANVSGVLAVAERTNVSALSPPGEPVYAVTMDGPESLANQTARTEFTVRTDRVDAPVSDLRVVQRTPDGWSVLATTVVSEANGTAVLAATTNASGTLAVSAVDAPTARIDGETVVPVGESATLDATASTAEGTISTYEWRVGDRRYDGRTTTVSFDAPGEYAVNLTVTDDAGLRDAGTATLVVNDRPNVTAEGPGTLSVGEAGTFTADVSDDVGNVTVTWTFGDATVEGRSVEHSFGSSGTKTVTVAVEDEYGATATAEVEVQVEAQDDATRTTTATTDTPDAEGAIPGFGILAAVLALVAAVIVGRRLDE